MTELTINVDVAKAVMESIDARKWAVEQAVRLDVGAHEVTEVAGRLLAFLAGEETGK